MGRGARWAAVHGVAKSWTRLSDFTFTFHFHALEKKMAALSSVLAWRIPGTVKPSGLPSKGLHRVGHDWSNLAATVAVAVSLNVCVCVCACVHALSHFSCVWHCNPTDWSLPGSAINGILQARILEWVAIPFSISSVQSFSRVQLFATPWIAAHQASLSITNPQSLLKPMPIKLVMPSNHLIFCCPLLLLPPTPLSIRVFSNESTLHMRWPKYWSCSFSTSPSNEHPGLISFRMTGWISLQSKGLSRVFSSSTVQKHHFFCAQLSSQPNSHIHTWPLEKP